MEAKGFFVQTQEKKTVIRLYGDVGIDILASDVAEAVSRETGRNLSVHIFSNGGAAAEALAIYNIFKAHNGNVETIIDGIAASAGGLIFMAGKDRIMPSNSLFHMHSAWGITSGTAEQMRGDAESLDAHSSAYRDIYASVSNSDPEKIDEWMKAANGVGTVFKASDALAAGFATAVVDPVDIQASMVRDCMARAIEAAGLNSPSGTESPTILQIIPLEPMAQPSSAAEASLDTEQTLSPVQPASTAVVQASIGPDRGENEALRRELNIRRCAAQASLSPEAVDALVAGGLSFEQCAVEIVKAHAQLTTEGPQASKAGHPARVAVTRDNGDTLAMAFSDELQRRAGLLSAPTDAGKLVYGYSAKELCRAWLNRNGVNTDGRSADWLIAQAFHSTSDLPALFENTMNKTLKAGYEEEPQTWAPLSTRGDLPDFKQATEVSFEGRLIPQQLTEGGGYKTGTVRDGKSTWNLFTYGLEVGITRQMMINDDLSALGEVPNLLGRGCRLLESNMIWNLVTKTSLGETVTLDNKALFHPDHNNTISGATTVIGIPGMDAAKVKLRKQQDSAGNSLNLRPAYLLAPPELETDSLQFLYPTGYAPAALTGANGTNPFAGGVELIVENRLSEVTNGTKMWYLTSSPQRVPMIRHGYLTGEAGPTITQEEKRNPDVLSLLVRMDFGCALRDWRGFVRSAGE